MTATCQSIGTYPHSGLSNFQLMCRGMRQKRYESVEKMLDLLDVVKRIGPKFPLDAMFLDPHDPEWDDDMTYLYVEYPYYKKYMLFATGTSLIFLYNYNMFFHNKNF